MRICLISRVSSRICLWEDIDVQIHKRKYVVFVLALACVWRLVGCADKSGGTTTSGYKNFEAENVSKLIVISVEGKRFEVTDTDTVRKITENIESIQFEKGESSENTNGFGPFIQWFDTNDNLIERISVMAEEIIIYDGFFGTDTDVPSPLDGVSMEVTEHSDTSVAIRITNNMEMNIECGFDFHLKMLDEETDEWRDLHPPLKIGGRIHGVVCF